MTLVLIWSCIKNIVRDVFIDENVSLLFKIIPHLYIFKSSSYLFVIPR